MADENPAANNPTPNAAEPIGPIFSSKDCPSSAKPEKDGTAVPAMRIAAVISPPINTEIVKPIRIRGIV